MDLYARTQQINPSTILRGQHPHIIVSIKAEAAGLAQAIPMSSSDRDAGLPTTYPIKAMTRNGLDKHSFALVHQITTLDLRALRQPDGSWMERMGQLEKRDKDAIQERLLFLLDLQPEEDWFLERMTFNLAEQALERLPPEERQRLLERQLDKL